MYVVIFGELSCLELLHSRRQVHEAKHMKLYCARTQQHMETCLCSVL